MIVPQGKTESIYDGVVSSATPVVRTFILESDTFLLGVYVRAVTGTVTVSVATEVQSGEDTVVATIGPVAAPTSDVLFAIATRPLSNNRVTITTTGSATLQVAVRGLSTADAIVVTGAVTVTATDLDIRNLSSATDSVTVTGTVSVNEPVTVDAVDLDIRNLSHVTDSVSLGDGTTIANVNADQSLDVTHSAASATNSQALVTTTAATLIAADTTHRRTFTLLNTQAGTVYIGFLLASTTDAIGFPLVGNGANITIDLKAGQAVFAKRSGAGAGSNDMRIIQTFGA